VPDDGTFCPAAQSGALLGKLRQCGRAVRFARLRLLHPLYGGLVDIPAGDEGVRINQLPYVLQCIAHAQATLDEL
jgi:hypothetical protein